MVISSEKKNQLAQQLSLFLSYFRMLPEVAVAVFCLKAVRYCMYMWLPMYLLNYVSYSIFFFNFYTPGIRSMPWGYNVFVFSVCVCVCVCVCVSVNNFRVRSITLKPLDIFS